MICVPIFGIPRSGTSLTAAILRKLGVFLGEDEDMHPPNIHNQRGYDEFLPALHANDLILSCTNNAWWNPPRPIASVRFLEAQAEQHGITVRIRVLLKYLNNMALLKNLNAFGFKDPRLAIVLPIWVRQLRPHIKMLPVVVDRGGEAVRRSWLRARFANEMTIDSILERYAAWIERNVSEYDALDTPVYRVKYEKLLERPESIINEMAAHLRLRVTNSLLDKCLERIDPSMNHADDDAAPIPLREVLYGR